VCLMIECTSPLSDPSRGPLSILLHILKFYLSAKDIVTDTSFEFAPYDIHHDTVIAKTSELVQGKFS
jgi:hypothetical protein